MPCKAELVCVDPKRVAEVWPHASHLIRAAIQRTNLNHFSDIEDQILTGDSLLWLAWDGERIMAAASTLLTETETDRICTMTACGGSDMREWLPLLERIETYAKDEGCSIFRIFGREGWLRILDGFHKTAIVIEKGLA